MSAVSWSEAPPAVAADEARRPETDTAPAASPVPVISCHGVDKQYYYYTHRTRTLREWFIRRLGRGADRPQVPQYALRDFHFEVYPGEVVALLGSNGSGKSTALRLMAGIYTPTRGEIQVNGSVLQGDREVAAEDFLDGRLLLLRRGKKRYHLVKRV